MNNRAYVYGLFAEIGKSLLCFYVGATQSDPHRLTHHGPESGAKCTRKLFRVLNFAGLPVTRKVLAYYDKNRVFEQETYWFRELLKRGHPLQNDKEPGDVTQLNKAQQKWFATLTKEERSHRGRVAGTAYNTSRTAEQRRIRGRKAGLAASAKMTAEQKFKRNSLGGQTWAEKTTHEQRSAWGRKGVEAKRAHSYSISNVA